VVQGKSGKGILKISLTESYCQLVVEGQSVDGIVLWRLMGLKKDSQSRSKKIQVVPKDSWAVSERIHWVNFSEEGQCCKNRARVSCNSSSIKPQTRRCPSSMMLLEVPYWLSGRRKAYDRLKSGLNNLNCSRNLSHSLSQRMRARMACDQGRSRIKSKS